mmetsp:Transcript_67450/g.161819  ORF Transcript_67450/g.161819 Transcript_67450/m.161819 type:complete len:303 (+) Transcript_67450:71-979(+)
MPTLGRREQDSSAAAAALGSPCGCGQRDGAIAATPAKRRLATQRTLQDSSGANAALLSWWQAQGERSPGEYWQSVGWNPSRGGKYASSSSVAGTLNPSSGPEEGRVPPQQNRLGRHLQSRGMEHTMYGSSNPDAGPKDAAPDPTATGCGVQRSRGIRRSASESSLVIRGPEAAAAAAAAARATSSSAGQGGASQPRSLKRNGSCPLSSYAEIFSSSPQPRAGSTRSAEVAAGRHAAEVAARQAAAFNEGSIPKKRVSAGRSQHPELQEPVTTREMCRFHDAPHRHGRSFAPPPRDLCRSSCC